MYSIRDSYHFRCCIYTERNATCLSLCVSCVRFAEFHGEMCFDNLILSKYKTGSIVGTFQGCIDLQY